MILALQRIIWWNSQLLWWKQRMQPLSTWDQSQERSVRYREAPKHPKLHQQHNEAIHHLQPRLTNKTKLQSPVWLSLKLWIRGFTISLSMFFSFISVWFWKLKGRKYDNSINVTQIELIKVTWNFLILELRNSL